MQANSSVLWIRGRAASEELFRHHTIVGGLIQPRLTFLFSILKPFGLPPLEEGQSPTACSFSAEIPMLVLSGILFAVFPVRTLKGVISLQVDRSLNDGGANLTDRGFKLTESSKVELT